MTLANKYWLTLKEYWTITDGPLKELNNFANLGIGLRNVLEDIDRYFGKGKETQNNYLKFMSKEDESDSADDEPDVPIFGKCCKID